MSEIPNRRDGDVTDEQRQRQQKQQQQQSPEEEQERAPLSPTETLEKCVVKVEKDEDHDEVIRTLMELQTRVASLGLFSKNETLDDVPTLHLPLLTLEYHLALALLGAPVVGQSPSVRKVNAARAVDLLSAFLGRLEATEGALSDDLRRDYLASLREDDDGDDGVAFVARGVSRDTKIARLRRRREAEREAERLRALRERRARVGADPSEELDGHDDDGLRRAQAAADMWRRATHALDEIASTRRELEMLAVAVKREEEERERRRQSPNDERGGERRPRGESYGRERERRPLEVTRVTQDATTGRLSFQREEIRSTVFRPSWNQPTMSLAELAEKEVADARQREEDQKRAEAESARKPRRYDQLVRDGMEDDADLVDQSAVLDRRWDEFREANPRGSGNKMTDRGDRNF